jgi:hypothetical protein
VLFIFYIVACIGNAVVAIVTFFLYVKARLADRTETRHTTEAGHIAHVAELDKKEKKYQSLHFITLSPIRPFWRSHPHPSFQPAQRRHSTLNDDRLAAPGLPSRRGWGTKAACYCPCASE